MIAVEIAIVVVLIIINGLLSMSEMAVVSSRRGLLKPLADRGNRGARQALALADAPGRFLSTVQIGITLIGVLAGAFSGATLADKLAGVLESYGLPHQTADNTAFGLVVAAITYLSLIIGELVPKQIALRSPERIAAGIAGPMAVLARIATPAVALLDWSSAVVLRLFGRAGAERRHVTEEEIRSMIAEAESAGIVDADERRMLAGVMRLADISVRAIMTPQLDIEWVDVSCTDAALMRVIRDSERTRLLACDGNPDNVVGVLHVREFLLDRLDGGSKPLRELLRQPVLLPDTLDALQALDRLRGPDVLGLVVDEYGHGEGIVTPADALQAIRAGTVTGVAVGEPAIVQRTDGSWLVSGALAVETLEDALGVPVPKDRRYHTVAGLILHEMRRVPATAESIVIDGWRLEVVDMDGRRIDQVLVAKVD
ncbi:HlyC/CorC family transporter [Vineibacter terrae]|uniref:HlyC/CorC family transporter n=1 Tax=Vineibacter terrae TaxID=2586908 RepID=A0A5C8PD74_9HYPH|nr:hemolysin family protein [Vineibacter terrae]TXL71692.1 HlyC/CorC family transporter [Vineibacter terrae]